MPPDEKDDQDAAKAGDDPGHGEEQDAGAKAGGEGGEDVLARTRQELAQTRRQLESRVNEAQRHQKKYQQLLEEVGGEKELQAFREHKATAAKAEQERLRKEGEFDKILAQKDNRIAELERELGSERSDRQRERVESAIVRAAGKLEAVDPEQVRRLYSSEFEVKDGKVVHKSEIDKNGNPYTPEAFLDLQRSGGGSNLFRSGLNGGSGSGPGKSRERGEQNAPVRIKIVGNQVPKEEQQAYEEAKKAGRTIKFIHENSVDA